MKSLLRFSRRCLDVFKSSRHFAPALMLAAHLSVFFLARLALLVFYYEEFSGLTPGEILYAFVRGIVFDASIVLTFACLPLLVLALPFDWAASKWCRRVCGWPVFAMLVVFAFVLGSDVVYFGEARRHAGPEVWTIGTHMGIILSAASREYLLTVILVLVTLGGVGYAWYRLLRAKVDTIERKIVAGVVDFVILAAIVIGIRGGFAKLPIRILEAFDGVPVASGQLVLNGPFSLYHSMIRSRRVDLSLMADEEAAAVVRKLLASGRERFIDDDYPLLRERTVPAGGKPNVVIVVLESWGALRIDCLRALRGLEPHGSTPNFDGLANEGLLFTRFYANRQRTATGIATILTGMIPPPGMPRLAHGMEVNRLGYLGWLAKSQGYATYYFQASTRNCSRLNIIAPLAGFDHHLSSRDIPSSGGIRYRHPIGAWDYDLFMKANEVMASAEEPFLGFVFTLSTHHPHRIYDEKWVKRPPHTRLDDFLNTLGYSDWALGEFFRKAKQEEYYNNTIFLLLADHCCGQTAAAGDMLSRFHIPLLVVAPGLAPGLCDTLGSQVDLIPTIMDLAGWSGRHAGLGRSLFWEDPGHDRFALCVYGDMLLWIEADGWVLRTLASRLESHKGAEDADIKLMEKRLIATIQALATALRRNRVFRPERQ